MKLEVVDITRDFLDLTFKWLKDSEIKTLTETPDFDYEAQVKWFESINTRPNYIVKGITADGKGIGVFGLKNISSQKSKGEFFGYIGDKNFWGKGIGSWMMSQVEVIAQNKGLTKIELNVLFINTRAINLYFKMNYKIVNHTDNSYIMEKQILNNLH